MTKSEALALFPTRIKWMSWTEDDTKPMRHWRWARTKGYNVKAMRRIIRAMPKHANFDLNTVNGCITIEFPGGRYVLGPFCERRRFFRRRT